MSFRTVLGLLGGVVGSLFYASSAFAQCSMDTDCKGDRVCEAGSCVAPALPPPPAPPSGAAEPVAAAPAPAAAPPPPSYSVPPGTVEDTRPKMQRHSTGMMAGGIVMVSFVPIALLAALVANSEQTSCENGYYFSLDGSTTGRGVNCDRFDATIYGGLLSAAALAGVGIPLIVIGGKKEPVGTAQLAPWATPHGAGLGLRIDL